MTGGGLGRMVGTGGLRSATNGGQWRARAASRTVPAPVTAAGPYLSSPNGSSSARPASRSAATAALIDGRRSASARQTAWT
ncbi:hypothetical protein FHX80_11111 [Streptomyces brevispora]|uniref:Uncharacterized protein n=1 Tax=Streptomyces brevispora TaxID=887462 RepID=A0A561UQU3_9ACTN|nr:hypothetical protein FHX80_11111 [Streptomyces brevispora]